MLAELPACHSTFHVDPGRGNPSHGEPHAWKGDPVQCDTGCHHSVVEREHGFGRELSGLLSVSVIGNNPVQPQRAYQSRQDRHHPDPVGGGTRGGIVGPENSDAANVPMCVECRGERALQASGRARGTPADICRRIYGCLPCRAPCLNASPVTWLVVAPVAKSLDSNHNRPIERSEEWNRKITKTVWFR